MNYGDFWDGKIYVTSMACLKYNNKRPTLKEIYNANTHPKTRKIIINTEIKYGIEVLIGDEVFEYLRKNNMQDFEPKIKEFELAQKLVRN
jgi:hypothetical protein